MTTTNLSPALFCVQSPFQCLCALEAISYFGIDEYDFYVPLHDKANSEKLCRLLDAYKISYRERKVVSNRALVKHWLTGGKYGSTFVGDYFFCGWGRSMAAAYTKRGGRLFYLDDGIAMLKILSDDFRVARPKDIRSVLSRGILNATFALKRITTNNLFTILDAESDRYNIYRNRLTMFHPRESTECAGVYIIGTNSSRLPFSPVAYDEVLTRLVSYIKGHWQGEPIWYCPHRGDTNNDTIVSQLARQGVELFDTQVSVEYDFIRQELNPVSIVGFNSAALYTLGTIYPKTTVQSVRFELSDSLLMEEHAVARRFLEGHGVESIDV